MRVVIAGGHGQIALLLARSLADAGHRPVGLIRSPAHAADVTAAGAEPVTADLEAEGPDELAGHLDGADAVVFAAGAGPGSSAARKLTVDRDGAIKLAQAAARAGIRRYVVISAIGADTFREPATGTGDSVDAGSDDVFQIYLRAKSEADAAVRATDLDWTIVRPGALTDDAPTGLVTVAEHTGRGAIPRADVAAVVAACLTAPATVGRQFEVISGATPVAAALR